MTSRSTSKTSALKSFKTYEQAETIPTPSSNEDPPRKTRRVTFEKTPKAIVPTEGDRVLAFSLDDQNLTPATFNLAHHIFNIFLKD